MFRCARPRHGGYLEDIEAVAAQYEFRKKTLNFMDFDDLLLNLRKLLREFPEVKRHYALVRRGNDCLCALITKMLYQYLLQ